MKEIQITRRDGAVSDECLEIDDLLPECRAIKNDRDRPLQLAGLHQRKHLEQLIECPESAWKYDQRARQRSEPELAHEKVMKLKIERARDVGVGLLLMRKADVEPDGLATRLGGAPVGGLHDARPAAGANHEPMARAAQALGPFCQQAGERARIVVVATEGASRIDPCRAEKNDGVMHVVTPKAVQRLEILGKKADR